MAANRIPESVTEEAKQFVRERAPEVAVGLLDLEGLRLFAGHGLESLSSARHPQSAIRAPNVRARPPQLFSVLNQWMLKVLLAPRIPDVYLSAPRGHYHGASQLAEAAGVSVMSAFRFVEEFSKEGFLESGPGVLRLVRLRELLNRWVAASHWILDTSSSTTRTILIDLRQPVPNNGAQQIFAYEYLPVRIIVKCSEAISGSFPAIALNRTLSCPTGISFQYGGNSYGLMMSSGPNSDIDYVETNNSQVTCTAVNSSANQCNAWTIAPIPQASGSIENIARLRQSLRNGTFANLGDFYVTFLFNVTNP